MDRRLQLVWSQQSFTKQINQKTYGFFTQQGCDEIESFPKYEEYIYPMLIFKGSKSTWNDGKDAVYQTICNGRYGCYNGKWIDFAEKLFYEETAKRFFDQMNINSNETKFSLEM